MALLNQYFTQKLIFENHPLREESGCQNNIQAKNPCSLCREECPHGVFHSDIPDWNLCDDCGLCVTFCPTRCISPSSLQFSNMLELCHKLPERVTLSCNTQETSANLRLSCAAAYPWEFLALLALDCFVTLDCSSCENCANSIHLSLFDESLQKVRLFLGDELYQKRIQIQQSISDNTSHNYTRREALSVLFSKSRAVVKSLLPENFNPRSQGLFWHQLLSYKLNQSGKTGCHWKLPSFLSSCSACNLCAKLCPCQAIYRVQDKTEPDRWYMALIPSKCTGCGLCTLSCPSDSMAPPEWISISDINRPLLHGIQGHICTRCKEPSPQLDGNGLCPRCSKELNRPRIF